MHQKGVLQLAQSRISSNNPDVIDVTMVMLAFESMNRVRLEVRLSRVDVAEASDLAITVVAHPMEGEIGEVVPLASVSVRCSAMNLRTLDSAVLAALYQLDFKLAEHEFASAETNKA